MASRRKPTPAVTPPSSATCSDLLAEADAFFTPPATVTLTIEGTPVPAARARVVRGHAFTPAKTANAEKEIARRWKEHAGWWIPTGGVVVEMHFFFTDKIRRDLDNLEKTVLDGLTKGGAWGDDYQVVHLFASKSVTEGPPHTRIEVRPTLSSLVGDGRFVRRVL